MLTVRARTLADELTADIARDASGTEPESTSS
jgi:hypothetical protein